MHRKKIGKVEYKIGSVEGARYSDILLNYEGFPEFPFCLFQEAAEQEENPFKSKILWLLADILSLEFDAEKKTFIPLAFFQIDDLKETDVAFLIEFLKIDTAPYIKGIVADVLFCKTKQFRPFVNIAIDFYLKMPIGSKNWNLYMQNAWQRALFLIQNREKNRINEIKNSFLEFAKNSSKADVEPVIWSVINVFDTKDFEKNIDAFDACLNIIRYYIPRISYMLIEHWSKAIDKIALVNRSIGDSLYEGLIKDRLPYFKKEITRDFLARASEINELLPLFDKMSKGKRNELQSEKQWIIDRSKELHRMMMKFESHRYSECADLKRRNSIEVLLSHTNPEKLFACLLKSITFSKKTYECIVRVGDEFIKNAPYLTEGVAMNVVNGDGSIISSNRDESQKDLSKRDLTAKEFQKYVFKQVVECIDPIFCKLTKKCTLTYESAKGQLLTYSSYLNESNVSAFAKGWVYGIQGDVYTALHLMVPHFDRLLLDFLKGKDVPVMDRDKKTGADYEKSPGKFLDSKEVVSILGEETVFQIKMLFYSGLGFDYRNRIAHGFVNEGSQEEIFMKYTWTFILNFLLDKANLT